MTDDVLETLDDIGSDVVGSDDDPGASGETGAPAYTVAQSVSETRQGEVTDERIAWLAAELDVPTRTVEVATSLRDQYRERRGGLDGTTLELVAASGLYCAAKVTEVPLDPTDIATADDSIVTRRALLRRSKDVASVVGLDPSAFVGSGQYVTRYCEELDLSDAVAARAHEIARTTEEMGLSSGKSPSGWAAAAVYNACLDLSERRTQSQLAAVSNSSEVTIRNRYQEQREALGATE